MTPTFAVVGHPNKGKSSIVATLAEDDEIAIGNIPGTTREARYYPFLVDGEAQYLLVDTPGFQRPRAVLDWLEARATTADARPSWVARFVAEHLDDARFHDECELLRPVIEGAGILYVVDGSKPYSPEYETEMQILQWTGRPRMALINLIGGADHVSAWQQALGQYFSIVRVFDAVRADFARRIGLLRAFAELEESWRPSIERAIAALEREREHRRRQSAREIGGCLIDCLRRVEHVQLGAGRLDDAVTERETARLLGQLQMYIRRREGASRDRIQGIYRHAGLARDEVAAEVLEGDIFRREDWELFGLSRLQLLISGAVSGALAGGSIDLLAGGTSFFTGAAIGTFVGAAGAWIGSDELARIEVLGHSLGGREMRVGPIRAPNFPWVLLGRAWVHHRLVSERNHARRETLLVSVRDAGHLMDGLPEPLRRALGALFKRLAGKDVGFEIRQELDELVDAVLQREPGGRE